RRKIKFSPSLLGEVAATPPPTERRRAAAATPAPPPPRFAWSPSPSERGRIEEDRFHRQQAHLRCEACARRDNPASMTAPAPLASTLDLIGNTPLVLLKGPSEAAGCEIWGKCEFAN